MVKYIWSHLRYFGGSVLAHLFVWIVIPTCISRLTTLWYLGHFTYWKGLYSMFKLCCLLSESIHNLPRLHIFKTPKQHHLHKLSWLNVLICYAQSLDLIKTCSTLSKLLHEMTYITNTNWSHKSCRKYKLENGKYGLLNILELGSGTYEE
jgi:hypothetical protein